MIAPLEGSSAAGSGAFFGVFFPYLTYLSPNALFLMMVLFVWLNPGEYMNYLSLYLAGKVIAVASFFAWEIFSIRVLPGMGNTAMGLIFFGGSVILGLGDMFSVWGAWAIKNKFRQLRAAMEVGGKG